MVSYWLRSQQGAITPSGPLGFPTTLRTYFYKNSSTVYLVISTCYYLQLETLLLLLSFALLAERGQRIPETIPGPVNCNCSWLQLQRYTTCGDNWKPPGPVDIVKMFSKPKTGIGCRYCRQNPKPPPPPVKLVRNMTKVSYQEKKLLLTLVVWHPWVGQLLW